MPTATIFGKLDCYSRRQTSTTPTDVNTTIQETYVGLFKFLEDLQVKGITELITYFSGAGGIGTGKDYWDTADAAGSNAFSVWKFNPYKDRNWEWYLYIHLMTGQNYQSTINSTPTRTDTGTAEANAADCSIIAQAAFSISGSSSINPWNGTFNLSGAAYKSSPVWTSGSPDYSVHVLPRINNLSGTFNNSKDLCLPLQTYRATPTNINTRYHFLSDGHSLLFFNEGQTTTVPLSRQISSVAYIGPYRLNRNIYDKSKGYLLGGSSSYGMCMFGTNKPNNATSGNGFTAGPTHTVPESTSIGLLSASLTAFQGGAFANSQLGVRSMLLSNDINTINSNYCPNIFLNGNHFDERLYSVYSSEVTYSGFLGWIESPLIRCTIGNSVTYELSINKQRAVFASDYSLATNRRLTSPWSGSMPGSNFTRQGNIIMLTNSVW